MTNVKPHDRFLISNYYFYRIGPNLGRKCGTSVQSERHHPQWRRLTSPSFYRSNSESAYLLVTMKCCLQRFVNLQSVPGVMQTSMSAYALGINAFQQVVGILNTNFGTVQFQTFQARNICTCSIHMTSKFRRHSSQLYIPLREMELCWIPWFITISDIPVT